MSLSLAAFATTAGAQPAPAPPPAEPPTSSADQPPTAPATAPAEAAATPPPAPPAAEGPKKLSVGKDSPGASFTPSLLIQNWFVLDESSKTGTTGDTNVATTTFRIRRIEVAASGDLIPGFVKYRVMFDPSRVRDTLTTVNAVNAAGMPVPVRTPVSPLSTLQDAYLTFQSDVADLTIGQFKTPISWEGYTSVSRLIMPERAFVANLLGGGRDLGLRLDKTFKMFSYSAYLFNGAGQNNFDNNNQKDIALRVEVYPIPGLTIAGMTYDSIGYRTKGGTKDRWEGDLRYESGPFLFQSEFIHSRDVFADGGAAVDGQGFYAAIAYKLGEIGSGHWKGVLQPVVRFGMFDPNTAVNLDPTMVAAANFGGNDERTDYEVGLNYYLRSHEMKLQVSYDRQQFDDSTAKPAINEVIVNAQVQF